MDWSVFVDGFLNTPKGKLLQQKVDEEYQHFEIFPKKEDIFRAFELTPLDKVRVVILGQDPYHDEGQAQGLAFSVPKGVKLPPSLRNIFKELSDDLKIPIPTSGDLSKWAKQGVLLLNTSLTVRAHQANSHQDIGWKDFTDEAIKLLNDQKQQIIFVLWGKPAQSKKVFIDLSRHKVIESPHPSPLAAYRGFFNSKPFSRINHELSEPIDWVLE